MQTVRPAPAPDPLVPDDADAALRTAAGSRSTWVSVAVNVALSALQFTIGIFSGSQGLIADALHSLTDLVSDAIVLVAGPLARREADADHPYGHHRFETAATLALGVLMLVVGLGMAATAVVRLETPEAIPQVHGVALVVAVVALIAKEGLFRYMLAVARRLRSTLLVANAWHARSDAASSLVVGIGIVGNLCGYPLLDPVAALIVGGMVARMGWTFGWDALQDLMDRGADEDAVAAIGLTLAQTPGVRGVHDLRTRRMGDLLAVDVHLEVDGGLTVEAAHAITVEARQRVMAGHEVLSVMTHLDPV
ncbi:cation diffusion facilitator family transporter [Xylophilus sp. GOD-11R]|uniref:cation diffusion facilitator family transporter n=1 Tax=Xylophilus sp. GOD-11R TaxID=3089814 RepID=UPI00298C30E6|nr:cation diffusion facilitator family transporter [Xylophilus sp. GOD-11R]WPB57035.1 cation diffusion facilitator family transporter [Xylophilus sp. GOD-11R]